MRSWALIREMLWPITAALTLFLNLGEYHLAIQDYDEALAIFPRLGEAYAGRARSYQFLGRDLEAQQDVDRAVEFGYDRLLLETEIEDGRSQRQ